MARVPWAGPELVEYVLCFAQVVTKAYLIDGTIIELSGGQLKVHSKREGLARSTMRVANEQTQVCVISLSRATKCQQVSP